MFTLAMALTGCGDLAHVDETAHAPARRTKVLAAVYGDDDRKDVYAHPDARWRQVATGSTLAMFHPNQLDRSDLPVISPLGELLGEKYDLCEDEPFITQPSASTCSGTLIDDDLVITAGHCVDGPRECERSLWVFGYQYESEEVLASLSTKEVFGCRRVLVTRDEDVDGVKYDWAIIQLDRPATPTRTPALLRASTSPLPANEPLAVIGYGNGTPAKIDTGARVIVTASAPQNAATFEATSDTFTGHSGAGAFDLNGRLVGVLSSGEQDYTMAPGRGCMVRARQSAQVMSAEEYVYPHVAVEALCAQGWPSERLCGTPPTCGDGLCNGDETPARCAMDCASAVRCGDRVCSPNEHASCPRDCGLTPDAWTCEPGWYGADDGCDCGCGAPDTDCEAPGADILHCEVGETCDAQGMCVIDTSPVNPGPPPVIEPPTTSPPKEESCSSAAPTTPAPISLLVFGALSLCMYRRVCV